MTASCRPLPVPLIHPSAALKFFLAIAHVVVARVRRTNAKYLDSLLPLNGQPLE